MIHGLLVAVALISPKSARAELEARYRTWSRAAISNDAETVLKILAPDYVLVTYVGKRIDYDTYRKSLFARKASGKSVANYTTSIKRLQVEGSSATVDSEEISSTPILDPITNKKVLIVHTHRYEDRWSKLNGAWRLHQTLTKLEATTTAPVKS